MSSESPSIHDLLERHRTALHELPGVVGTGIGFRSLSDPASDTVIQVFVNSSQVADTVRERAEALLGTDRVAVFVRGDMRPLDS